MRWLICLLFAFSTLFSDDTSYLAITHGEPSSIVESCVSAITGDYFISEDDIIVKGTEPIIIPRRYFSRFHESQFGGFTIFNHLILTNAKNTPFFNITDPSGAKLTYCIPNIFKLDEHKAKKKNIQLKLAENTCAIAITNCANHEISSRTNLINQTATLSYKRKWVTINAADGTQRTYLFDKRSKQKGYLSNDYYLSHETKPNGNQIRYIFNKNGGITQIATYAPDGITCYAWLKVDYHGDQKKNCNYTITTSDGKSYTYLFHHMRQPKSYKDPTDYQYLASIRSDYKPQEKLSYYALDIAANALLTKRSYPDGRFLQIDYYAGKVTALTTPAGKIHTFKYRKNATDVFDALGNKTTYHFNNQYRLTSIEHPNATETFEWGRGHKFNATLLMARSLKDKDGNSVYTRKFIYDKRGNPIEEHFIDQTATSITKRTYSSTGLLKSQTDPNGLITTYTYHKNTDLMASKLSSYQGKILRRHFYLYNTRNILTSEIIDDGSTANSDDLTSVTERRIKKIIPKQTQPFIGMPETIITGYEDQNGFHTLTHTTYTYDKHGNIASEKTPYYTTQTSYDKHGNPTYQTNPLSQEKRIIYDQNDNPVSIIDYNKSRTQNTYDAADRLITSQYEDRTTTHTYDQKSQKTSTTNYLGHTTTYTYDPSGNLITITDPLDHQSHTIYNAADEPIAQTDQKNNTIHTTYNGRNQPLSITYPDGSSETFTYDFSGNLLTHTQLNGSIISYTYDPFHRPLSKTITHHDKTLSHETWTYSGFRCLSHTDPAGYTTTYTYDYAGRKIATQRGERKTTYTYDYLNRLHTTTIHNHDHPIITTFEYDLLDRPTKKTKHAHTITTTYDASGNIASTTDCNGTHTYTYDLHNRQTSHTNPLGHTWTTTYHQNITTHTDPLGLQTIETYDPLDRLVSSETYKNKQLNLETFTYDPAGNRTSQTSTVHAAPPRTVTITWTYDSRNRPITLTEAANTHLQRTTHTTYDPSGNILFITKPSGIQIHYTYDSLNRRTSLTAPDISYIYTYDALGNITSCSDGTTRIYDQHSQLLSETLANNLTLTSTYDPAGNRLTLTLPDNTTIHHTYTPYLSSVTYQDITHTYAYNPAGQIITQNLPYNLGQITHTIDPLGRTTALHSPYHTHQVHSYDPVGNILSDTNNTYTYDDLYHITNHHTFDSHHNSQPVDPLNQLLSTTYDPDGNPAPHTYDALGRPTQIQSETYTYDSFHRRIYTNQTPHIYDNQNELGTPTQLRILGNAPHAEIGATIALILNAQTYIPLHDLCGNITHLLDSHANIIESYSYTPFTCLTSSTLNPWRYASKRHDPSGLINFGRRLYDPTTQRFLTHDPLGHTHPNLYQYNHGNPFTHIDPYGEFDFPRLSNEDALTRAKGFAHGLHNHVWKSISQWEGISPLGFNNSILTYTGQFSNDPKIRDLSISKMQSQQAFYRRGENWMRSILPVDTNSPHFTSGHKIGTFCAEWGPLVYSGSKSLLKLGAYSTEKYFAKQAYRRLVETQLRNQSSLHAKFIQNNPLKNTRYTSKVLHQMKPHPISKLPDYHGFPRIVDNYAGYGEKLTLKGCDNIDRTLVKLPGSYNGKNGFFEWIIEQDGCVNHRLFRAQR